MNFILDGVISAVTMIFSLNSEIFTITWVSLKVSVTAILIAALLGFPIGFFIATHSFKFKNGLVTVINSLLALPTVLVGLFIYSLLSRQGPLGGLNLLYTQSAMILGQTVLACPILLALTIKAISACDKRVYYMALSLGASRFQANRILILENKGILLITLFTAFSRIFAEVGASIMLGGNIKWYTRNLTTAIAFETGKGEFAIAVALGIILLTIALVINISVYWLEKRV